jgi:hypothetical protein
MQLLRDPNAAYALVILGLLAGFVELIRPGLILPGVCGAVMVMLGIAALAEQGLEPAGVAMVVAGWFGHGSGGFSGVAGGAVSGERTADRMGGGCGTVGAVHVDRFVAGSHCDAGTVEQDDAVISGDGRRRA